MSEKKINRREFVGAAVAGAALSRASSARGQSSAPKRRPNVLFILADDLGWGDLSCYGRPEVFEGLRKKYLGWESQMLKRPQRA